MPALPVAFGGAGRGGGCFDFLGGSAGVGLSTRIAGLLEAPTAVNGSLPNGSVPAFWRKQSTKEYFSISWVT